MKKIISLLLLQSICLIIFSSQALAQQVTYPISPTGPLPTNEGLYLWSNGGPTAAFSNENLKTTAVCNGIHCWEWNQVEKRWMRDRTAIRLSTSASFLQPAPGNILPWSGIGLTAGWENYDLKVMSLNNQSFIWVWSANPSPNGQWQNNNRPYNLATSDPWKNAKNSPEGLKPWSNAGVTSAFTNKATSREYVCQNKYCWVINSKEAKWLNDGNPIDLSATIRVQPASDGTLPWSPLLAGGGTGPTVGWTNQHDNQVTICNGVWCWSFRMNATDAIDLSNVTWLNNGQPTNLCRSWTTNATNCPGSTPSPTPSPTPLPAPTNLTQQCGGVAGADKMNSQFSWSQVNGAERYVLRINKRNTCTNDAGASVEWFCPETDGRGDVWQFVPAGNCSSGTCNYTHPLLANTDYSDWSVQAVRPGGTGQLSEGGQSPQQTGFRCVLPSPSPSPTLPPQPIEGDLNNDGVVNQTDYNLMVTNLYTNNCAFTVPRRTSACEVNIGDLNRLITIIRK